MNSGAAIPNPQAFITYISRRFLKACICLILHLPAAQPTICIWFSSFQLSLNTFKPRLEFLIIIVNPSYSDNLKETMTSLKITGKLQTKNLVYKVTYFLTLTPDYNLHSKYIFLHYHMPAMELINCQEKAEIIFQL